MLGGVWAGLRPAHTPPSMPLSFPFKLNTERPKKKLSGGQTEGRLSKVWVQKNARENGQVASLPIG